MSVKNFFLNNSILKLPVWSSPIRPSNRLLQFQNLHPASASVGTFFNEDANLLIIYSCDDTWCLLFYLWWMDNEAPRVELKNNIH